MNTWEFLRTLDKCEKHFSRVLKDSCVHIELNNALGALFNNSLPIGPLLTQGLTQTMVLRNQWASGFLCKRVDFIK